MGIKLISKHGSFLGCLLHMYEDGKEVKAYIDEEDARKVFEGLIPKASGTNSLDIKKNDCIVFDMVGFGADADIISKKGYYVVGSSSETDKWELDRVYGNSIMKGSGIPVPPSESFNNFEEAAAFVSKDKKRYVFKPNGNLNTSLTYVSSSPANMLAMLPWLERKCEPRTTFELQEFVDGVEMSTEAWFNGDKFILPINSTMEEKKLFPGGVGSNTGCMGNVVWFWDIDTSKILHDRLFKNLEPLLRKAKYFGPVDINAIWTQSGPLGLEFTARFGYDAVQAMDQLLNISMYDFLYKLNGMDTMPVDPDPYKYAGAVRVSIPPFPHSTDSVPQVPIIGITKNIKRNLYLSDVTFKEGLETGGYDGYIMCVADYGKSIPRLFDHIYGIIDVLEIPNKQYRNDIGQRVMREQKEIEKIIKKL